MYVPPILIPIYLDEDFVKNLSSLVIDGYLEKRNTI